MADVMSTVFQAAWMVLLIAIAVTAPFLMLMGVLY